MKEYANEAKVSRQYRKSAGRLIARATKLRHYRKASTPTSRGYSLYE